jgi:hypothetical protein
VGADEDAVSDFGGRVHDGGGVGAGRRIRRGRGEEFEEFGHAEVGIGDEEEGALRRVVAGDFDAARDEGGGGAARGPAGGELGGADEGEGVGRCAVDRLEAADLEGRGAEQVGAEGLGERAGGVARRRHREWKARGER